MARSIPEATIAVGRIRALPFGRPRTEAAAREVRLIEADGPPEVKAYALESLVEALTWSGDRGTVMVPFVKLLRWWDERPDMFDASDQNILFWEFGWIVNDLAQTSTVPAGRVDRVLDDMQRRFALAGRGSERVWSSRLEWELTRGSSGLEDVFTTWLTLPLDDEDSCTACHPERRADYLVEKKAYAEAIGALEDGTASGLACSREPASMLAMLTWVYAIEDRLPEAETTAIRALTELPQVSSASRLVPQARLFEVFGRGGVPERALTQLEPLVHPDVAITEYLRLKALRHYLAGTSALIAQGYATFPMGDVTPEATLGDWHATLLEEARSLTALFDLRHGNAVQAARLAEALAATPTSRPLTLPAPTPPRSNRAETAPSAEPSVVTVGPEPDATTSTAVELREQAEALLADGDPAGAARAYVDAAAAAEAEGWLAQSGWSLAELAHLRQDRRSLGSHHRAYKEALTRLSAAGVTLEEVAPVLIAWAPAVTKRAFPSYLKFAEAPYPSPAQPQGTEDMEALLTHLVNPAMVGLPLLRRYVLAWAGLKDATARVLAKYGDLDQHDQALDYAERAASRFAIMGRTLDAAHAWWLAGRLAVASPTGDVDTNYRLAIDGFAGTGVGHADVHRAAAVEYCTYLQDHGRRAEALEILKRLKG